MDDNASQVIEDIKWTLFNDRGFETSFKFKTWTGEHSFVVEDDDGQEYRVTVAKETK
ncbi:MAG: hypothetical protein J6S14_15505 [Clostridia bacterium]|nr:hypothetical protein [Clostridia bacterium]